MSGTNSMSSINYYGYINYRKAEEFTREIFEKVNGIYSIIYDKEKNQLNISISLLDVNFYSKDFEINLVKSKSPYISFEYLENKNFGELKIYFKGLVDYFVEDTSVERLMELFEFKKEVNFDFNEGILYCTISNVVEKIKIM